MPSEELVAGQVPSEEGGEEEDSLLNSFVSLLKKTTPSTVQAHFYQGEISSIEIGFKTGTIKILADGKIELSQGLTVDEAAMEFWRKLSFYGCNESIETWANHAQHFKDLLDLKTKEIQELKKTILNLEEKIMRLSFKDPPSFTHKFDLED